VFKGANCSLAGSEAMYFDRNLKFVSDDNAAFIGWMNFILEGI
jgi:hypothetical protein